MIPNDIQEQIQKVKELKVVNTNKTKYKFDSKTNTLYIPISETNFSDIFSNYNKLEKIELCIDNKIGNIEGMFYCCHNLKEILFTKKLNLVKVKDMNTMFSGCISLKKIDLSNIITSDKLKNIKYMFFNCKSLNKINFGDNFYSENIRSISSLFYSCYNLETVTWRNKQPFSSLLYMNDTFSSCRSLKQIDLRGIDFSGTIESDNTFYNTSPELKVFVNDTFREGLL